MVSVPKCAALFLAIVSSPLALAEAPSKTNIPVAPNDALFERDISFQNLAGGKNREMPEAKIQTVMRSASPSSYVHKDAPPILLVHGAKDTIVHIESTDEFHDRMKVCGADMKN